MSAVMFHVGELTDALLSHLATAFADAGQQIAIGDGASPADGGWANGQPGAGIFVPYIVLVSGGAAPRVVDIGNHVPAWACGYSLRSHGGSRAQCDWAATAGRRALAGIKGHQLDGAKVINFEWAALGAVVRTDATDPAFWSTFDTVTVVVDAA